MSCILLERPNLSWLQGYGPQTLTWTPSTIAMWISPQQDAIDGNVFPCLFSRKHLKRVRLQELLNERK